MWQDNVGALFDRMALDIAGSFALTEKRNGLS